MNRFFALAAVVLVTAAASPAAAQWPELVRPSGVEQTGANDVALLVSIEDYAFLPDVAGASQNLAAWDRFLRQDLGVPTVLVLKDQAAVREEILNFAARAASATSDGGKLWFVFIGHGAPNKSGDDGLLIGADGQQTLNSMMARGLARTELLETLEQGSQAETVVVLDACFSGRDGEGEALAKGTQPVLPINAVLATPGGSVVMTAASANEVAGQLPGEERPAFSYLLLGAMRGWGDDGDGNVTANEAVTFARSELLGVSGREQTPQIEGRLGTVLTRGVTESRPSLDTDTEPTISAGKDDEPPPTTEESGLPDGRPDLPFYVKAGIGAGGPGLFSDVGFAATVDLGVKFNAFTGSDSEWRGALWLNYFSKENSNVLSAGDTVTTTDGETQEVDEGDPVTSVRDHLLIAGVGPGYGWRMEGDGPTDNVFYIDSAIGIATSLGGECTSFETERSSRDVVCAAADEETNAFIGARAGFSWSWVDIALVSQFVIDAGFIAGLQVGFSFDP